jgi:PHD/YefM family antitoxin component YafN of YafNO toxin-antitoxin module
MNIMDFTNNSSGKLRDVVKSRKPLLLTRYRRPYVAVVPADTWREAEQALAEKRAREQAWKDLQTVPV